MRIHVGDRWDEALYDQSKRAIEDALAEASYARSNLHGRVEINPTNRTARIDFDIDPGPSCVIGPVTVTGTGHLPTRPIFGAALLRPGETYHQSDIDTAQRAVYALGAFSSVEVVPKVPPTTSTSRVIPIEIRVVPGRLTRFGFGGGLQNGTLSTVSGETVATPQWDVHLLGVYENRNLFGGLRRLRVEERPRLIFQNTFPSTSGIYYQPPTPAPTPTMPMPVPPPQVQLTSPELGNLLKLDFRQPAFIEPRTGLVLSALWDLGPDPFQGYFRHQIDARLGPERTFFDQRLYAFVGIHENLMHVTDPGPLDPSQVPSSYQDMFLEQDLRLDLRDDPRNPTRGAYFSVGVQEAGYFLPASWNYIRVTPEARGYVPLPLGFVLAARFGIGATIITHADSSLDDTSAVLGPDLYRLRGGGPNSNRGFFPGDLGQNGTEGGTRRWEGSVELRVPITESFGFAVFADAGDVSQTKYFRWNYLHLSAGAGLRYQTIVGPIRFDVGYRVPGLQAVGGGMARAVDDANLFGIKFPGAYHLTIGESF